MNNLQVSISEKFSYFEESKKWIKLYDKDECSPDSLSAINWLYQNNISIFVDEIKFTFGDTIYNIFSHKDFYIMYQYSCGVYQTVYQLTPIQAYRLSNQLLKDTLNFNLNFKL